MASGGAEESKGRAAEKEEGPNAACVWKKQTHRWGRGGAIGREIAKITVFHIGLHWSGGARLPPDGRQEAAALSRVEPQGPHAKDGEPTSAVTYRFARWRSSHPRSKLETFLSFHA